MALIFVAFFKKIGITQQKKSLSIMVSKTGAVKFDDNEFVYKSSEIKLETPYYIFGKYLISGEANKQGLFFIIDLFQTDPHENKEDCILVYYIFNNNESIENWPYYKKGLKEVVEFLKKKG